MPTCRDIITYAMRQTKVLASGDVPTADELSDGRIALQSLYDNWLANGMFGRLTDRYESADYTAEEGQRIIAPAGVVITIPDTIDGDPNSDTRAPRDLSVIETLVDGVRTVKLWDRNGWVDLLSLGDDDEAPLASRGAWGLAATLAVSGAFAAMFSGEPGSDVRMAALRFQNGVAAKFGSTQNAIAGDYF
jgi:hypothetical protein